MSLLKVSTLYPACSQHNKSYIHGFKVIDLMSLTIALPLFNIVLFSVIVSPVTSFRRDVAYIYIDSSRKQFI